MKIQALVALLSTVVVRGFIISTPSKHGTLKAGESDTFSDELYKYANQCKSLYGDDSRAYFDSIKVKSSNYAKIKVNQDSDYYLIRDSVSGSQTEHRFIANPAHGGVDDYYSNIECDTVGDGGDCEFEFYYSYGCKKSNCCYLSHDNGVGHPEKYIFCDNPADERNATGSKTSDGIEVPTCVELNITTTWTDSFTGKIKRSSPPYDSKCPSKDSCEYKCAESYDIKAVADNVVSGVSTIRDCACDEFIAKIRGTINVPLFGKIGKDMNKMSMVRHNDRTIEIHTWSGDTECPSVYKWSSTSSRILYSMISLLLVTILSFSI